MPSVVAQKITATRAEQFRFDPDGPKLQRLWDNQVPGLGLEAVVSGRKSWVYRFRIGGKQRIVTLGRFSEFDIDGARDRALEMRSEIRQGTDPKTQRPEASHLRRVQNLHDQYIQGKYFKSRSKDFQSNFKSSMRRYVLPAIGHLDVVNIKRWQIRQIVEDLVEAGKEGMAEGTLTHLRVLFGYAIDKELIEHSPADRIKIKRATSGKRDQWLKTAEELQSAWHMDAPLQVRGLVRWALLTGCRRDEARTTEREWISEGVWTVPKTKNSKELVLPVMPAMQDLIDDMAATFPGTPYLFPATTDRRKPLPRGTLDYIIRQATEGQWSMHVLRHTVESWMADLGITQEHRDLILNHIRGSMSERYRHGLQLESKRKALEVWHKKLLEVVS